MALWRKSAASSDEAASESPAIDDKAVLKSAARDVEEAIGDWQRRVAERTHELSRLQTQHHKKVEAARKDLDRAARPEKLVAHLMGGVTVFDDRLALNGKERLLTPEVEATADTAGNLSRTRRHTLTRFALLGPFSMFTPKATRHDDRELFLLVEGPDWADMVKLPPKAQAKARELAQKINLAARTVEQTQAQRRIKVAQARANLTTIAGARGDIEEARRALEAEHGERRELLRRLDALASAAEAAAAFQPAARAVRRAQARASHVATLLEAPVRYPPKQTAVAVVEGLPCTEPPESESPPDVAALARQAASPAPAALPPESPPAGHDLVDQLERLAHLKAQGLLGENEFAAAKQALLAGGDLT